MRFKRKKSVFESEKEAILKRMSEMDPCDEMYDKMMGKLQCLENLEWQFNGKRDHVRADTIALIAANLTGIIIVLAWEEKHVIATKAFGMISKLRL